MDQLKKKPDKVYYSMCEVAKLLQVKASSIRYWEKKFDYIKPKVGENGRRQFTAGDIESLKIIYDLVKLQGFTLQGAADYLKNNEQAARNKQKLLACLGNIKSFLSQLEQELT